MLPPPAAKSHAVAPLSWHASVPHNQWSSCGRCLACPSQIFLCPLKRNIKNPTKQRLQTCRHVIRATAPNHAMKTSEAISRRRFYPASFVYHSTDKQPNPQGRTQIIVSPENPHRSPPTGPGRRQPCGSPPLLVPLGAAGPPRFAPRFSCRPRRWSRFAPLRCWLLGWRRGGGEARERQKGRRETNGECGC